MPNKYFFELFLNAGVACGQDGVCHQETRSLLEDTGVCSADLHTGRLRKGLCKERKKLLWGHRVGGNFLPERSARPRKTFQEEMSLQRAQTEFYQGKH